MPLDLLFEVRRFPVPGSKINSCGMTIQGGGPIPNVLVGLRRLGYTGALITAVADDMIGRLGLEEIARAGVDTSLVVTKAGTSDAAIGLIEQGSGTRTLVLNREIRVEARDLRSAHLPPAKIVHMDGRDMPACLKLARWAHKQGAMVCFDIGSVRNDVSEILPLVDHLVVADAFALPFTGGRTVRQAVSSLSTRCPGTIVVTAGTKGAVGFENGGWVRQRAFRVAVADTTGAGDAFHTGYFYGLLRGATLEQRLRFGAAVAALKCTQMGARTGLPNKSQLNIFLKAVPEAYA